MKKNEGPRIADSELLKRWKGSPMFQWGDFGDKCTTCGVEFSTGDVTILFGDPVKDHPAIERGNRVECHRCGMTLLMAGEVPSGGAVYVEKKHRDKEIELLSKELKTRLVEGFAILDAIDLGIEVAAKRLELVQRGYTPGEAKQIVLDDGTVLSHLLGGEKN
jgi:hypothetical protein